MSHRKSFRAQLNSVRKAQVPVEFSFYLQPRKSEHEIMFHASVIPLKYGASSITEIRWTLSPKGQHSELQNSASKSETKFPPREFHPGLGDLVYTTCRNIQEPVHSIMGLASLLKEQTVELEQPEMEADVNSITERAERINTLVSELIEIIRLDAGWSRPRIERIAVAEFIREAEMGIQLTLKCPEFQIINDHRPENARPQFIISSPVRLRQAIIKTVEIAREMCNEVSLQISSDSDNLWFNILCDMSMEDLGLNRASTDDKSTLPRAEFSREQQDSGSRAVYRLMLIQRLFEVLNIQFAMGQGEKNCTVIRIGLPLLK
jgi:hypothetical protein